MSDINTTRRGFFKGAAAMVGAGAVVPVKAAVEAPVVVSPYEGTKGVPLKVGAPCLQAPGETTMGVSWSVSGLSKGVVEIADNPEMKNSRIVKSGGYGLVPVDVDVLQVRLEGLKPVSVRISTRCKCFLPRVIALGGRSSAAVARRVPRQKTGRPSMSRRCGNILP